MDNGGISPKLYLSYIYDWALLFGLYSILQECFHQQTPEPIPPSPSHRHRAAPSRNVIQYLCILRIREKCVIEYHDDRHRRHRNMCSCKSFYGSEPTHCKLTTHVWPSFKPDVREISTWEAKTHCWHRHSFVSDTALCCTKEVTHRWQKTIWLCKAGNY